MKRILLTLTVFLTFSIGYAQNEIPQTNDNSKVFKQTAGSNSFAQGDGIQGIDSVDSVRAEISLTSPVNCAAFGVVSM